MLPILPLVLSSASRLLEPPDLWQTRVDAPFRDRARRIERIDGADQIVVEADQLLSGIGLISNAGARFEAPETISVQGRFEDVLRGGYDPEQHLKDRRSTRWPAKSSMQRLFCFKVADPPLMSASFRGWDDASREPDRGWDGCDTRLSIRAQASLREVLRRGNLHAR